MHQFQASIGPWEGILADLKSNCECQWQACWERRCPVWEHLQSQYSSVWKTTSCSGILQVRLEIIATTNCSMFFTLTYSVCIVVYVSMYLYSYPSTHGISGLAPGSAWEKLEVCLKMTIKWTQRYTMRRWSSKFGDALGGIGRVDSEIHFEAVIEREWRHHWRPRLIELRDVLAGCDRASFEMQLATSIEWTQRYTLWPWSRSSIDALAAGYDHAGLE